MKDPTPVGTKLIDFVQHDHWIHCAGVTQSAHQPSRQSTDISAAMPADLGFIADTA